MTREEIKKQWELEFGAKYEDYQRANIYTAVDILDFAESVVNKLLISGVSNCGDKHLTKICDKEGHQMSELWYVNKDRVPFQLEHSDKCCICGYEDNSI
tara:strand:+ start:618 stop:914 length:297 start_codon:yes stop_codon:yes gene_type:complete